MIIVIDYGMGNLHSVRKALEVAGASVKVSSRPADIKKAEKIVFPGVGAFGEAMKELKRRKLIGPIKDAISSGKPFLGLCLGLQLLFEKSDEAPGVKGLGVLRGKVKKFRLKGLKVPHMGWNVIKRSIPPSASPLAGPRQARSATGGARYAARSTQLLKGVSDSSYMYFVHSYYAVPKDKKDILTITDYGIDFTSGIARDNIYALQFHPEKSQEIGLRILRNFVHL